MAKKERMSVRYVANQRGYVDGRIVEEGEAFTTAAPKGSWMDVVDEVEYKAAMAANDPTPDDPSYDTMTLPALQAVAATMKLDVVGLSKADALAVIKAKRQPTA